MSNETEEDIIISQDMEELLSWTQFYLEGVCLLPVSIIGIIGNTLSVIVLSTAEMQNNFNHLLVGLASFDLLYLLTSSLIFSVPKLSEKYLTFVLPYIMPIGYGIAHIGRVGSVLMTLSVTLERFFAIVHPLKRLRLKTALIATSVSLTCIYNVPRFFEFETVVKNVSVTRPEDNVTEIVPMVQFAVTELRMNMVYVHVYVVWMKFILVELIPYIAIIVLNAMIILKIRNAMRERHVMTNGSVEAGTSENMANNSAQQNKEKNMAIVLTIIVVMFIVCQSIKIIPDMYEAVFCYDKFGQSCPPTFSVEFLISISHLLLAVNSASNFIIYMLRGDKFRQIFIQMFIKGQCTKASRRSAARFNTATRMTVITHQHRRRSQGASEAKIKSSPQ